MAQRDHKIDIGMYFIVFVNFDYLFVLVIFRYIIVMLYVIKVMNEVKGVMRTINLGFEELLHDGKRYFVMILPLCMLVCT